MNTSDNEKKNVSLRHTERSSLESNWHHQDTAALLAGTRLILVILSQSFLLSLALGSLSLLLLHVLSWLVCHYSWHHFYCWSFCLVSLSHRSLFSAITAGRYLAVSRAAVCSQIQNSHSFAFVMFVACVRLFWHWQVTVKANFIKNIDQWSHFMNQSTHLACNDHPLL